jgi:hypothetical protein
MNAVQQMKRWARAVRDESAEYCPGLNLSHGQALEVVVALVSSVGSWNAWIAGPGVPELPQSMEAYLCAVARGQKRIRTLGVATGVTRRQRFYAAVLSLAVIDGTSNEPLRGPWQLLAAAGTPLPNIHGYAGSEVDGDAGQFFNLRLSAWFFRQRVGRDVEDGQYPGDLTRRLARSMGFSAEDSQLIGEVQREAPNHSWSLYSWLEVGVLDPDQHEFLCELQQDLEWRARFEYLLQTDDERWIDEA